MKKRSSILYSESGVIHAIPLLVIVAAVGIISYLLISSAAPFKGGLFGIINSKPPTQAATSTPIIGTSWSNVTSNLAGMSSECGNLTMLSAVPGSDAIIAGIAQKGLWESTDSGTSWIHLGSGTGSDVIVNRPSWITYDPTVGPSKFWESGIYNSSGAYITTNSGNSFQHLGSVTHDDFISVDFTDPNRQTILVGGHEQSQSVWKSTNGGQTWTNIGLNLPPNMGFSTSPIVINAQTFVANVDTSWSGRPAGIFRTTDGGASWTKVSTIDASGPPLMTSNGTIYWATGGSLAKSTDGGQIWTVVGGGLSGAHPIELPDGSLVSIGGGKLQISSNGGSTWSPIGPALPYSPPGVIYSVNRKAFFINNWDCGGVVLSNAIEKLDADFGFTPGTTPTPTPIPTVTPIPTATPVPTVTPVPTPTPTPSNQTTVDDSVMGAGVNQFNYQGSGWGHCTNCGAELFNGSNSWDQMVGDTVTFQFNGQKALFSGVKDPSEGKGAFSVDNGTETLIDLFSQTRAGNQLLYVTPVLSPGTHTLKLRVTGTTSGGTTAYVTADGITVIATANTPGPSPSCLKASLGDVDCDGTIGIFDFNLLVTNFGKTGPGIPGDIDNTGKVDIFDFNILVTNFGQ